MVKKMSDLYNSSAKLNNDAFDSYFDTEPDYSSLPIKPGKINDDIQQSAVNFINVARIGAGLNEYKLNKTLSEKAQAKAAYTMYLSQNGISNPSPHYPPKAEGVSDDFYKLCQPASAENLYMGNALTSVINALDDGEGDSVWCGHRYNLLGDSTDMGLGATAKTNRGSQGAHEFSGYASNNNTFTCWPSNGVTPYEHLRRNSFTWTIKSKSDYEFDDKTEVEVELLNTGKKWLFSKADKYTYISSNIFSFYDGNLAVSANQVYKVTLNNALNKSGKRVNYSYRSAIMSVYNSNMINAEIKLESDKYEMAEDSTLKIKPVITIAEGRYKDLLEWSSSDSSIAEVSKCGVVTAHKTGTVEIALLSNGVVKDRCTVTVREKVIEPETTEAVTTEPETTQPVTTQSVTSEPVTSQPITTVPMTTVEPTESSTPIVVEPQTTAPYTQLPSTQPDYTQAVNPTQPTTASDIFEPTEPAVEKAETIIKKPNPIKVTVKTKTVKAKKLKKKAQKIKAVKVKYAQGKVTYKLVKSRITRRIRKLVKINSKGVMTIKKWKKAKIGVYKIKVKIKASGNANYRAKSVIKTLKVRIK